MCTKDYIHVLIDKYDLTTPLTKEGAEFASKWVKDIANYVLSTKEAE